MTRSEALKAAERCFREVETMELRQFQNAEFAAGKIKALAEAGRGYIELAKELRLGA